MGCKFSALCQFQLLVFIAMDRYFVSYVVEQRSDHNFSNPHGYMYANTIMLAHPATCLGELRKVYPGDRVSILFYDKLPEHIETIT